MLLRYWMTTDNLHTRTDIFDVSICCPSCSPRSLSRSLRLPFRTLSLPPSCSDSRPARWSLNSSVHRLLLLTAYSRVDSRIRTGINIVYRRLPILALRRAPPSHASAGANAETTASNSTCPQESSRAISWATWTSRVRLRVVSEWKNWRTFVRNPIFYSSLSISLLYLTVLSFDGSMLAYLKSHSYPDPFVAGMRGVGVVTGLMGTLAMPMLEKRIGLVRTGTWSVL